ncbi:MAG TPA: PQQ-binding-like beta-propeller repeat protein, partial [Mycobacteriales bacterium]|nr:PQQ-binding-like beta-propeller repeat protein [Mycobacteriales bacterium]
LVVLDVTTGRELWATPWSEASSAPTTAAAAGGVVVLAGGARTTGFDARTGGRLWDASVAGREGHALADPPTFVVIDDSPRAFIGLDPRTGNERWSRELSASGLDAVVGPATPLDGGPLLLTTGYDVPRHRD